MVQQYKAFWSIPNAGPAVTTFHAAAPAAGDAQQFADGVRTFFSAMGSRLPDDVAITFDTEVTTMDPLTGALVATEAVTPPAIVPGVSAGAWAAGSGARIIWATDVIRNSRRVRGTTYIVPLAISEYSASGRVAALTVTALNTAASSYVATLTSNGITPVVWSRPIPGRPGSISTITGFSTSETVATLRSRKY